MTSKISAISSFKRTVLGHDAQYYVKKGTDYLNRADLQHEKKYFSEAQRLVGKARSTFNKISAFEKTKPVNRSIAQAYLNYGDRLQARGAFPEARVSYEAAQTFDPDITVQRLQIFDKPKPSSTQDAVSQMVMALSIHSVTSFSLSAKYFEYNPALVAADQDVSVEPREIRNTVHLARSLCSKEGDGKELNKLNELAGKILNTFGQQSYKHLALWREVIPLVTISDPEKILFLIDEAYKVIAKRERLLDLSVLQSTAVMIYGLPESFLKSWPGHLVQLLQGLTTRLSTEHQSGNTQSLQQLLQTTSQVLDAMARVGVSGISREQVQEPLDRRLKELSETAELWYQAYYARQALAHIPNDESRGQEIWRRSKNVAQGAVDLASVVCKFDLNKLEKSFDHFSEAFSGSVELVKNLTELATEMRDFKATVGETGTAIREGISKKRQQRWYAALQFLDHCLEKHQYVEFEHFVRKSEFNHNEAFLLGVCQRLEQIICTREEDSVQHGALAFLAEGIIQNKGQSPRVEQAVYQALSRLQEVPKLGESIRTQVKGRIANWPDRAALGAAEGLYVAPVWDPAWQQVGNQLLCQARGDEADLKESQETALRSNKKLLAPLGEDIQALEAQYMQSLKVEEVTEALEMYVAPQGKRSVESTSYFDLEDTVNTFFASDKKVLLLLGEAGSGKSTFNRHLARRLWKEYSSAEHPAERPIPLFIPLATLDDPGKNLIEQYLREQGLSQAQIDVLRAERNFIFILDGYDEIAHRSHAFYVGNKLERWKAKVVISSRPEYLGVDYQDKFYPSGSPSALEECRLVGFSDVLIDHYIDKYVNYAKPQWEAKAYKQAFKEVAELKELVRTPFMLKMTLKVLPELQEEGLAPDPSKLTRIRVYETFVENWLKNSKVRLGRIQLTEKEEDAFAALVEDDFTTNGWVFSQNLALAMYQERLVTVTYSEAKDANKDWRSQYLGNTEAKTRLLRFNAPLSRQRDQYRFIHKSIQDYCVARAVWEELENLPGFGASTGSEPLNGMRNVQGLWEALKHSDPIDQKGLLNRFSLVEDAVIQRFLVERVEQNRALVKPLLAWIQASTQTDFVSQGAANAITILVKAGIQFNGMDLQGIRIPGADLSDGVFDSAQLERADLRDVNLRKVWLRNANLNGAQMAGVKFSELRYLQEKNQVNTCVYSPDGKSFAVGFKSGAIRVYGTSELKELYTLSEHADSVSSVTYSPNSQQIASGSDDHTIRLWDAQTGQLSHTLRGHTHWVLSMAYSPNRQQIASGSLDETVRLWDTQSGALGLILQGHTGGVSSVVYSPNGQQIASGSDDKTVRLWDAQTGQLSHTLRGHLSPVRNVKYSPNSKQVASGSWDKTVRLWDAQTGQLSHTLDEHTDSVWSVTYSPNGQQIASGSNDKTVRLWDAQTGQLSHILDEHTDSVWSLTYSPNGQQIASGSNDKTVRLWDVETAQLSHTLLGHNWHVMSVKYSSNGQQIASSGGDSSVRLWDAQTAQLSHTLRGHTEYISNVKSASNDQQIASGRDGQTVWLWNTQTNLRHTLDGHTDSVLSLKYSLKSQQIASSSDDQTVRLWDATTGQLRHTLRGHTDSVWSVKYSPNGGQIASGSDDHTVRLWDAQTGQLRHTLDKHTWHVRSVKYSPDGRQIASGSGDHTVRLWDAQTGQLSHTLSGHTSSVRNVKYSPDSQQVASGSWDKTVRLWDAQTGQLSHTLSGHTDFVRDVKYSSNGEQLASGSDDKTVRLWDTQTGKLNHTLKGHTGFVLSLTYAPNDRQLASGSYDKTVRLWDTKTGQLDRTLNGHADYVSSVKYAPNGEQIVSASKDQTVKLWDIKTGQCQRTIKGFDGPVTKVAWKAISDDNYLVTGSADKSVRLWRVIKEGDQYQVRLCWSSAHDVLTVEGTSIEGVRGLVGTHEQLLKQRGAVGEPLSMEVLRCP